LRVVDWEHPANNDFLLVTQFSVTGAHVEKGRRLNEE
jgi:type I site-specific restriction-modification system R (restriction) subunit